MSAARKALEPTRGSLPSIVRGLPSASVLRPSRNSPCRCAGRDLPRWSSPLFGKETIPVRLRWL